MTDEPGTRNENAVEETVEELFVDPDSPDNSETRRPPQTIDNEPGSD